VLAIDATGEVRGDDVALALGAKGDIIPVLQTVGGDSAIDAILGTVLLQFHNGSPLIYTPSLSCVLTGDEDQGDDFDGGNPPRTAYANTAAFEAYVETRADYTVYDGDDVAGSGAIDAGHPFNGHNTLKGRYGGAAGYTGAGFDTVFTDDGDPVETPKSYTDFWSLHTFEAQGFVTVSDASEFTGMELLKMSCNTVAALTDLCSLNLRGGRLVFDTTVQTPPGVNSTDLGDDSLVQTGGFVDVITHTAALSATQWRTRFYIGTACTVGLTRLAEVTWERNTAASEFEWADSIRITNYDTNDVPVTPAELWLGRWGFTDSATNSNPYQVVP
jgi:hypothetical protein